MQAREDYIMICKALRKKPSNMELYLEKCSLESFFHSRWCALLSDVNGEDLLDDLRRELLR